MKIFFSFEQNCPICVFVFPIENYKSTDFADQIKRKHQMPMSHTMHHIRILITHSYQSNINLTFFFTISHNLHNIYNMHDFLCID